MTHLTLDTHELKHSVCKLMVQLRVHDFTSEGGAHSFKIQEGIFGRSVSKTKLPSEINKYPDYFTSAVIATIMLLFPSNDGLQFALSVLYEWYISHQIALIF